MLYWLIESLNQLKEFYYKNYQEVFIEPIFFNDNVHPLLNDLSLLYIKPLNGDKGYIICISHDETLSIEKDHVENVLKNIKTIYVRNHKNLIKFFPKQHFIDISYSLPPYIQSSTKAHDIFYQKHKSKLDINKIIPVVKHYERCELLWDSIKDKFNKESNSYYSKLSKIFFIIENNGIKIDESVFNKYFDIDNKSFNIRYNTIYTNYNVHTTTGRPSNSFNSINFAALNKDTGCRKAFIPKNNLFVEYDFSAYHPILASRLVGYDFGEENPYEYFAKEANIDIGEAKTLMFKQLYGGIYKQYEHINFFKKIKEYTNRIWEEFQTEGKFECPGSNHVFYRDKLKDMNASKLFNYLLQNQETFSNVNMLWDILKILKDKNTQLVLYTYDAFLFDLDDDEIDVLGEIEGVFRDNKLKVKQQKGKNYDFTKRV